MTQRVYVKVMGFTDVERHALNTVFRLSEQREPVYALWMADAPGAPQLALIDGQSPEAALELEAPRNPGLKLIWVGAVAPAHAWRTFQRPISWPDVLYAMDQLFTESEPAPPPARAPAPVPAAAPALEAESIDFDLEVGGDDAGDTLPPPSTDEPRPKRALIASASREERLYMRARLALSDLTQADDAETGAEALELTRLNKYAVAMVDFALPDVEAWAFLKELTEAQPAIPNVIITKAQPSIQERLRARMGGAKALFGKPPDPEKLQALLDRV